MHVKKSYQLALAGGAVLSASMWLALSYGVAHVDTLEGARFLYGLFGSIFVMAGMFGTESAFNDWYRERAMWERESTFLGAQSSDYYFKFDDERYLRDRVTIMVLGPHTVSIFGVLGGYMLWETVQRLGDGNSSIGAHVFGVVISAAFLGGATLLARSLYQHYHNMKVVTYDELMAYKRA